MRFIGIDLAWSPRNKSGAAVLEPATSGVRLLGTAHLSSAEVLPWIDAHATDHAVIGVDAPLVITVRRVADNLVSRAFWREHACCYPARPTSRFAAYTSGFAQALEQRGFAHAAAPRARKAARIQMEVHPHAATVRLFGLSRIVKYKRGSRAERAAGLQELRRLLSTLPGLEAAALPETPLRGSIKPAEDQLDAITAAYVAAYWWMHGEAGSEIFGSAHDGYIVVPRPTFPPFPSS